VSDWGGRDALPPNASPEILEEERIYQANLKAAQVQMAHELTCEPCRIYAAPVPGKARTGKPCIVGMRFWSVPVGESGQRTWEP
jgi:hypothetical protein